MSGDTFTFSNGVTVQIRPVSPFLINQIRRQTPPPRPPKVTVEYEGKAVQEENHADPDFLAALQMYEERIDDLSNKLLFRRGVALTLGEQERTEIQALRDDMTALGSPLPDGDDELVYLLYLCCTSLADYNGLLDAIMTRGQPTEEAIGAAAETFPGDVPGA